MENEQSGKMNKSLPVITLLIILIIVSFQGCNKDGGVCVSTSGPMTRQIRNINDFNQVELNDNVCLILTTDSISPLVVEAGRNILGGITTTVDNGHLILGNTNTCNWLRDYNKPINVYISAQNIWRIRYNGSGDVTSIGTIKLDSLTIEVWGGCGTIDLSLDVWQGNFSLNMGTVDFRLRGVSAITSVYTDDYGLYDGRNLKTGYTFITSNGSNDCYVQAINSLDATIGSIGNIYYTGNPANVKANIKGTGKLLPF
jgi:hypothetical protein